MKTEPTCECSQPSLPCDWLIAPADLRGMCAEEIAAYVRERLMIALWRLRNWHEFESDIRQLLSVLSAFLHHHQQQQLLADAERASYHMAAVQLGGADLREVHAIRIENGIPQEAIRCFEAAGTCEIEWGDADSFSVARVLFPTPRLEPPAAAARRDAGDDDRFGHLVHGPDPMPHNVATAGWLLNLPLEPSDRLVAEEGNGQLHGPSV